MKSDQRLVSLVGVRSEIRRRTLLTTSRAEVPMNTAMHTRKLHEMARQRMLDQVGWTTFNRVNL